jgi:antitoxin YefM
MLEITANNLPEHFQQKINHCVESHEVLYVNRTEGEYFVVIGAEDWRAIEETIFLNKIPELVKSIHQAHQEPLEQGTPLKELDW